MHITETHYIPEAAGANFLQKIWQNLTDIVIDFNKAQYASKLDLTNEKDREKLLGLYADGLFASRSDDLY